MADLDFLTYATVKQSADSVVGDTMDPGTDPDFFLPWCDVTITPRLVGMPVGAPTNELQLGNHTPEPLTLLLAPFPARIETGILKAVRPPAPATDTPTADEVNAQNAFAGLRILAQTDALELPPGAMLVYDVKYGDATINGQTFRLQDFTFAAPTTDTTIYLTKVDRINTAPSTATNLVIRRIPDHYEVDDVTGDVTIFDQNGSPMGPPFATSGGGGGTGNMVAAIYDPTNVADDAFDRANHHGTQSADTLTDGATNHVFTAADDTKLTGIAAGATANATDAQLRDRSTHTGTQSADSVVDGATNKAFTAAEKTKLGTVASGATANSTDAALRDRATHTGTQPSTSISDLTEAVQDIVGSFLAAGTGITVTYDDAGNVATITAIGGGGSFDPEATRDTIGAALLGSGLISVTVNDAGDTITIATTATQNSTDAALRDRATHTGTQSADTVVDGATNKAYTATEKTKLGGIATGATANATDAALRDRSTHTGTQSADTLTDGATNRLYSSAEKTKLAGVATGATANDTDANLKNRANHTGTQTSTTISDLTEAVQDIVAATLVQGSGVTLTYDDAAGSLTVGAAGGASGGYTRFLGDGATTTFTVTHNLGITGVPLVAFKDVATNEIVDVDPVTIIDNNSFTVTFAAAPATNGVQVTVAGGVLTSTPADGSVTAAKIAAYTIPYDVSFVQTLGTRAVGLGQNSLGVRLARAVRFTSITYRTGTAAASGDLVVELRKNGVTVVGSSKTITAPALTGTVTGTFDFAAGDILTVYVTATGTTPGNGLVADITGAAA